MRTFIASLLAVSALAAQKSSGSYDYSDGGASWKGDSNYANNICGMVSSMEQSPIDLDSSTATENADLSITMTGYGRHSKPERSTSEDGKTQYMPTNWMVTLAEEVTKGAELVRRGPTDSLKSFSPAQYHFHTPSEHTVNGELMDAEIHIVHYNALTSTYAVVGIFFDTTESDETSSDFLDELFAGYGTDAAEGASQIDFSTLLDGDTKNVWMYDGSFTTPPCTEGVKWTVLKEVQLITQAQLERFNEFTRGTYELTVDNSDTDITTQSILDKVKTNSAGMTDVAGGNNRAIQALNERTVYQVSGASTWENANTDGASALMASAAAFAAVSFLAAF